MPAIDLRFLEMVPPIVLLAIIAVDRVEGWLVDPDDRIDAAHVAFKNDDIPLSELERRIEENIDDRNERIRRVVDQVSGIGPSRADQVARHFDSVADLEAASIAELQEINDVGPSRAQAIHGYLHGDDLTTPSAGSGPAAAVDQREASP